MAGFALDRFMGAAYKPAARLLPPELGQAARNIRVGSGDLEPLRAPLFVSALGKAVDGAVQSIYPYQAGIWFHWLTDVDMVPGPLPEDRHGRLYFTGDGAPRMTYAAIATTGGGNRQPNNSYRLGIPAPPTTPTLTLEGTADDPNDPVEPRTYVETYVSELGEEGPPCLATNVIEWQPGQTVKLANLNPPPAGNYNVTHRRIYRLNLNEVADTYRQVAELPIAKAEFTDSVRSDQLGAALASLDWDPPPEDLQGLILLPNGVLAGFSGQLVCFSEPNRPHAWPIRYRLPAGYPIVALAAVGTNLAIATTGEPYLAVGAHPEGMVLQKLEIPLACVSKRGMADFGDVAVFPSGVGMVAAGAGVPRVVTEHTLNQEQWQAFAPESIHGYRWGRHHYVGFYNTGSTQGGFILDPRDGSLVETDIYATAGYSDPATGDLYLVVDGNVVRWDAGDAMTGHYTSREYLLPHTNLGAVRVDADGEVALELYGDDTLRWSGTVAGQGLRTRSLPAGYRASRYVVQVASANRVRSVELVESAMELQRL